jgi:sulfonate transport system ATP-binding protein
MLVLDRVGKTYPNGVRALDGISVEVAPGEILAVIGGSGCGKSTMLRAISGLDPPTQGQVVLDGAMITAPHEQIGIVFQEPRLLPWLRVVDNVGFGLEHQPKVERKQRVTRALDRVGLRDKATMWPRELSGGQAQRVALLRALVPRPEVLLLDEPFSALDAFTRVDLQAHLLDLWADAKPTLLMVTHDVEEAIVLADRVMVMRPHPGRVYDEIPCDLPRPRDRQSAAFDFAKRRVSPRSTARSSAQSSPTTPRPRLRPAADYGGKPRTGVRRQRTEVRVAMAGLVPAGHAELSHLDCTSLTRTVIPAERAGLCPASESRNPVNDAVNGLTQDVVYWAPARARPLGRARLAGTTAKCDCLAVHGTGR